MGIVTANLIYHLHAGAAEGGTAPGHNDGTPTGSWYELVEGANEGTLSGFGYTTASGWDGTGSTADPYCLVGDGTGDIVSLASDASLAPGSPFTMEVWYFRATTTAANMYVFGNYSANTGAACYINTTGKAQWRMGTGTVSKYPGGATDGYGAGWIHSVVRYDGTAFRAYVNGALNGSAQTDSWAGNSGASQLFANASSYLFAGKIAAFRIYDADIGTTGISQNYAAGPNAGVAGSSSGTGGVEATADVGVAGSYVNSGTLPTVSTVAVTDITYHSATSGGVISDEGSAAVTAYGVVWSTMPIPSLDHYDPHTIDSSTGPYTATGAVFSAAKLFGTGTYVGDETIFYVDNYLAHGDGVTNDAPFIEDAFNAAHNFSASGLPSKVMFTSGKTYLVSTGWNMPTIRTNDWYGQTSPTVQRSGTITMSGYGATIKYANATTRFCWLQTSNPTTQYTTYGNLVVEGFTIDNNFRQPTADCGTVLWLGSYANKDNITVRDVTMLDRVTHRTTYDQSRSCMGIYIQGNFTSRTQAHVSYMTGITVDGCIIYGQAKPLAINVDGTGNMATIGTNPIIIDDVLIKDSTFDSCHHYGSNVHIGAHASGGTVTVSGCTFNDSCDDGLEINAFDSVTVTGCTFHANRQPICHTWFSFPMSSGTPQWSITNCTVDGDCNPYWDVFTETEPGVRSPFFEIRKYAATAEYAPGDTRSWGDFTVSGCNFEFGVTNSYASHHAPFTFGSNGPPLQSVTISNCDITDVGFGGNLIYVRQGSGLSRTLPVSIHDVRWRSSTGGSYVTVPLSKCSFSGSINLSTDMV